MSLYSSNLKIGIAISRSSAISINVLLIFDILDLNEALFLKTSFLFAWLFRLFSFLQQYKHGYNHTNLITV